MENLETTQPTESLITVNSDVKSYLLETAKWCKFLAIAGFVGMGILVLLGILVMVGLSIFRSISQTSFPMGAVGFVYIIFALIYYFPLSYMYKFSVNLKKGLNSNDQQSVNYGFENLKSLFKFMGIFTLVVLSIYALVLIIMIPVGIIGAMK
jgi:membrane-bound metal-dependent hydrolase YbcI (DUF457 family)